MRGKQQYTAFRDFVDTADEDGTFLAKCLDHVLVMYDLVVHIDRLAEFL